VLDVHGWLARASIGAQWKAEYGRGGFRIRGVAQVGVLAYLGGAAAGGNPLVAGATPVGEYANRGHPITTGATASIAARRDELLAIIHFDVAAVRLRRIGPHR
jgi:hypothetical protein